MNSEDNEVILWTVQQSYLMDNEDNEVIYEQWRQRCYLVISEDNEVILWIVKTTKLSHG